MDVLESKLVASCTVVVRCPRASFSLLPLSPMFQLQRLDEVKVNVFEKITSCPTWHHITGLSEAGRLLQRTLARFPLLCQEHPGPGSSLFLAAGRGLGAAEVYVAAPSWLCWRPHAAFRAAGAALCRGVTERPRCLPARRTFSRGRLA